MNLYTLSDEEKAKLHHLPTSLDAALDALEADHDYLTRGGEFPEALLKNFIAAKRKECAAMAAIPHPAEFERYYNLREYFQCKKRAAPGAALFLHWNSYLVRCKAGDKIRLVKGVKAGGLLVGKENF